MANNRCIFSGMKILEGQQWLEHHAIIVENHTIKAIIPEEMIKHHLPAKRKEFPNNHFIVPGFIDIHIHGTHNKDVMDGDVEAMKAICRGLAEEGVTGFLATTMTAENERIDQALKAIVEAMPYEEGARILGIHLEGPFLSKNKMGAQRKIDSQISFDLFDRWQKIANGNIKIATLAPELPGSIPFINSLRAKNVITSIGHTDATYDETMAAISAGASQATHLFNAMSGLHQRQPGAAGALLLADTVCAELIVDGIHLHPAMVDIAYKMKSKDRLFLVTDGMRAKCIGNGTFDLGGQAVSVTNGKATLSDGTIAGSTLRMNEAIKNMDKFSKCSLIDAIKMATVNPAVALGFVANKGTIAVGFDADLVVLNANWDVIMTIREGREIYSRHSLSS